MLGQDGKSQSAKQNLRRSEFQLRNRYDGVQASFRNFGKLRHAKQLEQIMLVKTDPALQGELLLLLSKFEKGIYLPQGQTKPRLCCLFNAIIAFDWNPGYYELELLRHACDQAADLLFDATNGYMTFNRFIVGGPELMQCADIQIFPSNRLYPRAWVNGLNIDRKYQPIRVGRGYWRKNIRRAEPWHKGYGAAVLVHEWLHYACGLKDSYVKLEHGFALPEISPVTNTLMANLDSNELLHDQSNEWALIRNNSEFTWLFDTIGSIPQKTDPETSIQEAPPDETPRPLFEVFGTVKDAPRNDKQIWLNWRDAGLEDIMDPGHCWVFLLTGDFANPKQLIAQGSYETLPEGYRLIGALQADYIILIGQDKADNPKVLCCRIPKLSDTTIRLNKNDWQEATPNDSSIPLVAVSVDYGQTQGPYDVSVHVKHPNPDQWTRTLFPLGTQQGLHITEGQTARIDTLDGNVLLFSEDGGRNQLMIANFSIGGSPGAAYPGGPNPVPAGSSDGNAMIFFYDEELAAQNAAGGNQRADEERPSSALRVITTTNLLGPSGNVGQGPRSYTFAVMPNRMLTISKGQPDDHPTLVLYFDDSTMLNTQSQVALGGTLNIHRYANGHWIAINSNDQKVSSERLLVAAKLNNHTAPGLFDPNEIRPEYYRLFLT